MAGRTWVSLSLFVALFATPAVAGPPYATDDPDPTDPNGIEAYVFTDGDWSHGYDGAMGVEANYGAAPDVQLSVGLPLAVMTNPLTVGRDNVELSAKWRFAEGKKAGWSVATFPGVTLPTAKGARGVEVLLPVWAGWRKGDVAVFGGGGRVLTTVPGTRDHWVAAIAATRQFGRANFGIETTHEGAAEVDGHAVSTVAMGAIVGLGGPFAFVARAGPAFEHGTGRVFARSFIGLQAVWAPKRD